MEAQDPWPVSQTNTTINKTIILAYKTSLIGWQITLSWLHVIIEYCSLILVNGMQYHDKDQMARLPAPIARFMGLTWGPSGANRTQVGPMLAPWTLLSERFITKTNCCHLMLSDENSFLTIFNYVPQIYFSFGERYVVIFTHWSPG